jgi:HAD superfamily hydrolase (TIGR01662 family)
VADHLAPTPLDYAVVVPTVGRPSLGRLLASLAVQAHAPAEVVVVDDRPAPDGPLDVHELPSVRVLAGGGCGPAHARNAGWQVTRAAWTVFVDDDVELPATWSRALVDDLTPLGPGTAGSQARVVVPVPPGTRPTDEERATTALEGAVWATAEMAYRRDVLEEVGGFDERFPRAFREDADLALRVRGEGYDLVRGDRHVVHPLRPGRRFSSLARQRGNADDALMRRLHGPGWHERAACPPGALRRHVLTVAAAAVAVGAGLRGRRTTAAAAAAGWAGLTASFAARRLAAGPRTPDEVLDMVVTSVAIPPLALWHRVSGTVRHRAATPWPPPVRAVLFDRDGTLVHDVPYNGDPSEVRPVDGARDALDRLRARGVAVGLVTNQSGVGRGLLTRAQVDAVNGRVAELLGPFDTVQVCPHAPAEGCACRKPMPGMVRAAACELGVHPREVVVVGDIGADAEAALAAGSRAVLVPTPVTRPEEVAAAPRTAATLTEAVDLLLADAPTGGAR